MRGRRSLREAGDLTLLGANASTDLRSEWQAARSASAVVFRLTPLVKNTVLGALVEPPTPRALIRAASSKDFTQRLGLAGAFLDGEGRS